MVFDRDDPPPEFALAADHWDSGGNYRLSRREIGQQLEQQGAIAHTLLRFGAL